MSTDVIKELFGQNIAEVLTYLLIKETYIDLPRCNFTYPLEKDIEKNKDFLSGIITKYDKEPKLIQIRVTNKEKLENLLKEYINAYKEDKLNLNMNKPYVNDTIPSKKYENFYPYIINLFKMYEILEDCPKGEIKNLDSFNITDGKTLPIRFPEMILDLYFQEKPYIKIENCTLKYLGLFPSRYTLKISMKLNKTPLEIYKVLLFDYYLNQGLSKSNNKFLAGLSEDHKNWAIKIFKAYADGARSREEIGNKIGISKEYVKQIEKELRDNNEAKTLEQLLMKAVLNNVIRCNSTF